VCIFDHAAQILECDTFPNSPDSEPAVFRMLARYRHVARPRPRQEVSHSLVELLLVAGKTIGYGVLKTFEHFEVGYSCFFGKLPARCLHLSLAGIELAFGQAPVPISRTPEKQIEGLSFIEMELVRGTSLAEQVRAEGPLPPLQAVRLCAETLAALARVHQGGIVHRDIKPGNILVDQEGRARLTDFGLSRLLEETTTLAGTDRVVGSPHFMAPEQWRGEAVSARTDLYATGLVLYFALTARLPYEGESLVSLMYRHLHDPLLRAGEPYPLPDYLCQVIRRATEKHPAARFESAEEFRCALLALEE